MNTIITRLTFTGLACRRHIWPRTRRGYTAAGPRTKPIVHEQLGRQPMDQSAANVTQLLRAAASGQRRDVDALMSAIYDDLRRLAFGQLRGERCEHTLQPTALVHEAYLKLIDQRSTEWKDRGHFFSVASRVIRRILVDHARERRAQKRGGDIARRAIETADIAASENGTDLIALDEALNELQVIDPLQAKIVEMRYFGGLTIEEIAETLDLGKRSVDRHWQAARAWLCFRLNDLGQEPRDAG